ncbi:hypothetical protein PIB30_021836 [Stylosanthes scabra]|uniref:Uncharacterized protein n=1 Tax=Stylosanthes scabra TaxID=79078 RepID=A0ABU6YAS2_9FABA|nr:hypothetical protein [Stylosanthes scabra]
MKSIFFTIRTLKLQDHFDPAKALPQFEEVPTTPEKDVASMSKVSSVTGEGVIPVPKKSSTPKIIQNRRSSPRGRNMILHSS